MPETPVRPLSSNQILKKTLTIHATGTSGYSCATRKKKIDAATDEDTSCGVFDSTNSDASVGSLDRMDAGGSGDGGGGEGSSVDGGSQASDSKVCSSGRFISERSDMFTSILVQFSV